MSDRLGDEVSRWFVCDECGHGVRDPYAEIHNGMLVGECECGAQLQKEAGDD